MEPLVLSDTGWWQDIENYMDERTLSHAVGMHLRTMINTLRNEVIPATVRDALVRKLAEELPHGIVLGGTHYQILVWIPNDLSTHNQVALLTKTYPEGHLVGISHFS